MDPGPLLPRIRRYVEIETPSGHAAGIDALATIIAEELAGLGAAVRSHDAPGYGRNLVASIEGAEPDLAISQAHAIDLRLHPFDMKERRHEVPQVREGVEPDQVCAEQAVEYLAAPRKRSKDLG